METTDDQPTSSTRPPDFFQLEIVDRPPSEQSEEEGEDSADFSALFGDLSVDSPADRPEAPRLLHERQAPENHVVFVEQTPLFFSPDGRLAFALRRGDELHVLDLVRNVELRLRNPEPLDGGSQHLWGFVFVDARTIVGIAYRWSDRLCVLRLDFAGRSFTRRFLPLPLQPADRPFAFALTEIRGAHAERRRAVVNTGGCEGLLLFVRLDLDRMEATFDAEHAAWRDETASAPKCRFDLTGRRLFVRDVSQRNRLCVYELAQKKWTTVELGGVDMRTIKWPLATGSGDFLSYTWRATGGERLFRCDVERREWVELPVRSDRIDGVSPIVGADGREDGVLLLRRLPVVLPDQPAGAKFQKTEFFRVMFRTPDRLLLSAMKAVRLALPPADFQRLMDRPPFDRVLRSASPNMRPIPVRCIPNSSLLLGWAKPL
ncbi:hypothetical protein M3Y99_01036800 [Aphelenchoides fujianensis]|nr:hypothetical protein M3Y99_01036800 [Aphelenchoides fujianensis]